jgi:hypothetical protein
MIAFFRTVSSSLNFVLASLLVLVAAAIPATAVAAAATHFSVAAPASIGSDSAFNMTVTALDGSESTDTTYSGISHFTSSDVQAVLPADATLTNGVGTFSATLKTTGSQTITVSNLTVTISGADGTFTLTFNGQTTSPLAFNASAAQVQNALNGLSSVAGAGGSANVTKAANVYTVVFGGALSGSLSMTGTGSGGATVSISSITGASSTINVGEMTSVKLQEFEVK